MVSFAPKQRLPLSPAAMQELMADVTLQVARKFLKLIPPIPSGSTLHDNACGNGIVTEAITEIQNPGTATAVLAESKGWKNYVKTEVMSAEALKFEDNFFSYSFNKFHIFIVKEPEEAAAQVYRTLKLGGIAVVTSWAEKPFENDILKAHEATRGLDASHVYKVRDVWKNASHLVSVLEEAGFNNIETETYDVILKINNVEYWSKLAWSFLGAPNGLAGGRAEKDEERFDEAVGIVYDALLKNEKVESDGAGGAKIRMTATSVIAKK